MDVSVTLDGFRYVQNNFNIKTGKFEDDPDKKEPLMSEEIKKLLFEDLDISKM